MGKWKVGKWEAGNRSLVYPWNANDVMCSCRKEAPMSPSTMMMMMMNQ
jgi:hypothetical protein